MNLLSIIILFVIKSYTNSVALVVSLYGVLFFHGYQYRLCRFDAVNYAFQLSLYFCSFSKHQSQFGSSTSVQAFKSPWLKIWKQISQWIFLTNFVSSYNFWFLRLLLIKCSKFGWCTYSCLPIKFIIWTAMNWNFVSVHWLMHRLKI